MSIPSIPLHYTKQQCDEYRRTINERMNRVEGMRESCTAEELAFFSSEGTYVDPLILYQTTDLPFDYDHDNLKQSAFQQISVCCGAGEPMSVTTIHRDFSLKSEWNDDLDPSNPIKQQTRALFDYIDTNAETLVNEMCELGLLQQCILAY